MLCHNCSAFSLLKLILEVGIDAVLPDHLSGCSCQEFSLRDFSGPGIPCMRDLCTFSWERLSAWGTCTHEILIKEVVSSCQQHSRVV